MNALGLTAAVTAFFTIWLGHVGVRKIESVSLRTMPPIVLFVFLGLFMEFLAINTLNQYAQVILGIAGVTLLWDGFEIHRQEKRIRKGHAPANPKNPRHAALLEAEGSLATVEDLLAREPSDVHFIQRKQAER